MKKLSKKTFITIFSIISSFLIIGLITVNIEAYHREYENVKRNLSFNSPMFKNKEKNLNGPEIDNMMIMDYEIYTIKINGSTIEKIISHGRENNLDIKNIASELLEDNDSNILHIGNLYYTKYAYNLRIGDSIVILNTSTINNRLSNLLITSIIILFLMEIVIYYEVRNEFYCCGN